MKRFRYIISGMMMALIAIVGSNSTNAQPETIQFLETYTNAEVTSRLDQDDKFFQLIDVEGTEDQGPILGYCKPENTYKAENYMKSSVLSDQLPDDIKFCWGIPEENPGLPLYAVKKKDSHYEGPLQSEINHAEVPASEPAGGHSLLLTFNKVGAEKWAKLTGKNIGKHLAIVINDTVRAAPMVREEIRLGRCMITGEFSLEEVQALKTRLDPIH